MRVGGIVRVKDREEDREKEGEKERKRKIILVRLVTCEIL